MIDTVRWQILLVALAGLGKSPPAWRDRLSPEREPPPQQAPGRGVRTSRITVINKFLTTLPETDDRPSLPAQFGVFCAALIQFTSRHHLRYPVGDEHG